MSQIETVDDSFLDTTEVAEVVETPEPVEIKEAEAAVEPDPPEKGEAETEKAEVEIIETKPVVETRNHGHSPRRWTNGRNAKNGKNVRLRLKIS